MSTFVSLTSLASPQSDTALAGPGHAAARRNAAAGASAQSQSTAAMAALVARSLERHLGVKADTFTYEHLGQQAPAIAIQTAATPAAEDPGAAEITEAEPATDAESVDTDMTEGSAAADDQAPETSTDGDESEGTDAATASDTTTSGNGFVLTGNEMLLRILSSDSGYDNRIVMSFDGFKTWTDLGTDNQDLESTTSVAMGAGTVVEFGIVNGEGALLRAGDASLNEDGLVHAQVDAGANGMLTIGFEDLSGGGDADFDDARIEVVGAQPQTAAAAAAAEPIADVAPSEPAPDPDDTDTDDAARSRQEMQATIGQATLERNRQLLASLYNLLPQDDTDPGLTSQDMQDAEHAADAGITATVATQA